MASKAAAPKRIDFFKTKYGRELLLDAAWLSEMPAFDRSERPYSLNFFDILLVTEGRGTFALDGEIHEIRPGVLFLTRPGEVRRWREKGLDGACLFFTAEFVQQAFVDARLIDQFAYWRAGRPTGAMQLTRTEQREFLARFGQMRAEFDRLKTDADHILRARLYEILVLLNRWYAKRHGDAAAPGPNEKLERFIKLVDRDFACGRPVTDYAAEVGLSTGHLNALCQGLTGKPAGAFIRDRIVLEAKRRLLYSDADVATIGYELGFADPAYFTRYFKREAGATPTAFRRQRG